LTDNNKKAALTEHLRKCYSGAVYDALRERGIDNTVLPKNIRPIDDTHVLAGPVFTISGTPKPGISADDALLAWTGFLSTAPSGHVVVCNGHTDDIAMMGELSAETLQMRGVRGYVTNGGCRDSNFIRNIGFPVFHRFYTARDVVGAWSVDKMEVSVQIGDVVVKPGDFLIADIDGAILIPGEIAEEIVAEVEEVMNTENKVRSAIRSGTDPKEAYLTYGRF